MNNNFEIHPSKLSISSISDFCSFKSSILNLKKEGLFVRFIGIYDKNKYLDDIKNMDKYLTEQSENFKIGYLRLNKLDSSISSPILLELENYYNDIITIYNNNLKSSDYKLPFKFEHSHWEDLFRLEFFNILDVFCKINSNISSTILKNFIIKLLFWVKNYFPKLFLKTKVLSNFPKFVFSGDIKLQEYLFLNFLYSIGCDVLYLNPREDIKNIDISLLNKSMLVSNTNIKDLTIPNTIEYKSIEKKEVVHNESTKTLVTNTKDNSPLKELEYSQLAKLSSSVVKISVFNKENEAFSFGSGVFINKSGHLLTNFHVIANGFYYGIQIEDSEELIFTSEIVKYHHENDLAVLKLDVKSTPLPIHKEDMKLVRGQKIVTIGSPLGLFNSISDGIISGFRDFNNVSMIQISAPISPGSSGGALLDLYGNLIGITTSGFDKGQNLNLAVSYKNIYEFASGFLTDKFFK